MAFDTEHIVNLFNKIQLTSDHEGSKNTGDSMGSPLISRSVNSLKNDSRPLRSLTHSECIKLLQDLDCVGIDESLKSKNIVLSGELLSDIEDLNDLTELGIVMPTQHK